MKAVRVHRFGGPEVLQLDDIAKPEPGSERLLIRISAASVNPVDYKIRRGGYARVTQKDLPVTLGRDVAGVVETAAGEFAVGEEVYAHLAWTEGGYAEFAVVSPSGAALKPKSLTLEAAAGVPLAATTAWQGLFDHGALKAGDRVLIFGASGAVGSYAVQFAKTAGAFVVATASGAGVDLVKALGADVVVDYTTSPFEASAQDMDLVLDLVGGEMQTRAFPTLRPGGALISGVQPPDETLAAQHQVRIFRFLARPDAELLRDLAAKIDAGSVTIPAYHVLPLAEAAEAHRRLETGHARGKIILAVA